MIHRFEYILEHKNDVSLAKELEKHVSKDHRKHGVIDNLKYKKRSSKIKYTGI